MNIAEIAPCVYDGECTLAYDAECDAIEDVLASGGVLFWTVYEWSGTEKQAIGDYSTERAALDAAGLSDAPSTGQRHLF